MSGYQFTLPVKSNQLEAIGMVAVEWAYLESIVEAAIWNLAYIWDNDTAASVTTHLGMPARLDILMTLFRLRTNDETQIKNLQKMCGNIRGDLSRQRGEVVHTRWIEGDAGSPMIYLVRARGKLERTKRGSPAVKIREVAGLIAAQSRELREFLEQRGIVFDAP
jgi:hypothetical protein